MIANNNNNKECSASDNGVHYHYHYYFCKHHRHWVRNSDTPSEKNVNTTGSQPQLSTSIISSIKQSSRRLLKRQKIDDSKIPQLNSQNEPPAAVPNPDYEYVMQGPIAINQRLKTATGIKDTFDHRAATILPAYKENYDIFSPPFSEPLEPKTRKACEDLHGAIKKRSGNYNNTIKPHGKCNNSLNSSSNNN